MKRSSVLVSLACLLIQAAPAQSAAPIQDGSKSVFLEDLTTNELKDKIVRGCTVALIYSGSTEETGPHVALGKHIFRARAYSAALAREIGDAVVAPILPFAPVNGLSPALPGGIALAPETFSRVNEDVARSLVAGGMKRIALLNDHGGAAQTALRDLAAKLDKELSPAGVRVFFISDGYQKAREAIEAEIRASGKVAGGHGGLWDVSETMAAKADAVRPEKFHPGNLEKEGNGPLNEEGFSGDPRGSSVALGRHFGEMRLTLAAAELRADLAAAGPCK
jgi:creatinine amidohydrolase/Fe(II)-dependent formamide hydrolase-like protein